MTVNWAAAEKLAVAATGALTPTGETPANTAAFNLATFDPGSRLVFVVRAVGDDAQNTGGTLTLTASATSGGAYTALTSHVNGELPTGTDAAGVLVSARPDPARPWVRLVVTGEDSDADMTLSVVALLAPRGM